MFLMQCPGTGNSKYKIIGYLLEKYKLLYLCIHQSGSIYVYFDNKFVF